MGEKILEWMMEHETATVVILSILTAFVTSGVLMAVRGGA